MARNSCVVTLQHSINKQIIAMTALRTGAEKLGMYLKQDEIPCASPDQSDTVNYIYPLERGNPYIKACPTTPLCGAVGPLYRASAVQTGI